VKRKMFKYIQNRIASRVPESNIRTFGEKMRPSPRSQAIAVDRVRLGHYQGVGILEFSFSRFTVRISDDQVFEEELIDLCKPLYLQLV